MSKYVKSPDGTIYAHHAALDQFGWPECDLEGNLVGEPAAVAPEETSLEKMKKGELVDYAKAVFGVVLSGTKEEILARIHELQEGQEL